MPSLRQAVGIVAVIANLRAAIVGAHPGCFTPDETPDPEAVLTFCPLEESGACCTPTQENDAIALFEQFGPLTDDCADYYKQVVCGACSSYSIHLYEVLGNDLGLANGMTMKRDFCEDLVSACDGQVPFPDFEGESYCDAHVVGESDLVWSYPIDSALTTTFESQGLVEAFPDLDDDDFPNKLIAMHMTPDGSEWWLAGQTGEMMKVSSDNPSSSTLVVDLTDGVGLLEAFEEGLLDFAFSPDFHNNGFFYCSYTVQDAGRRNRLGRFTYDSGSADNTRDSLQILLTSPAKASTIHSGGWCGFKPSDYGTTGVHDLYWAIGDGGPQEDPLRTGGDTSSILASIVRIQVSTNSDVVELSPSGNVEGPVCANGFRNPFRCGFDSVTDELYCGDVGHTNVEEIDIIECGNDYGWSRFEGSRCQEAQQDDFGQCATLSRSGLTFPIFEYCHPDYNSDDPDEDEFTSGIDICGSRAILGGAVIGGYVYHGEMFSEVLGGALLFSDSQQGNLYYLFQEDDEWVQGTIISDGSESIISFAEANNGEIFVIHSDRTPYLLPCGDLCATTCLDQSETQPEFESLGCFGDLPGDRALQLVKGITCPPGEDLMSPNICSSYCATLDGATLFGVEFAFECFCGSASDDFDKHGELDSESCSTVCTGVPDQFCGGTDAIEIYSFTDGVPDTPSPIAPVGPLSPTPAPGSTTPPPAPETTTPPTPAPEPGTPSGFTFLGCFEDSSSDRVLSVTAGGNIAALTTEGCADLCEGSEYFGTEFGKECFCSAEGDVVTGLNTATCNMECTGTSAEFCGGFNAISLYEYSDISPTPVPPTPDPTPEPTPDSTPEPTPDSTTDPTPEPTPDSTPEPTPEPTEDEFTFLGCYGDVQASRVFSASVLTSSSMTTELCAETCTGFTFFGTQYSTECWCGGADADPDANGPAVCNFACAGDASQICGGFNALSAYEYTNPGTPPAPTPNPAGFIGCFTDSQSARIMGSAVASNGGMTVEGCAELCEVFPYYGVQYGRECYCSDDEDFSEAAPATNCNFDCAGDSAQTCGGFNAMSAYAQV